MINEEPGYGQPGELDVDVRCERPDTVKDLRKQLTALAKKKSGKQLISEKFTTDHNFAGPAGDVGKLAAMLSKRASCRRARC